MQDDRFKNYIFESHTRETLRGWAQSLHHIRFCRAFGGHSNDGDTFRCSLCFHDESGVQSLCQKLSLKLASLSLDTPRPIAGKSYTWDEYQKFLHPIEVFPHLEQPGHTSIFGVPVFVWINSDSMDIQLSGADGDSYIITAADFQNAKRLDNEFGRLGLEFRDPPMNSQNCICPKFWPEFFTKNTT
jgi:hypothetical protein